MTFGQKNQLTAFLVTFSGLHSKKSVFKFKGGREDGGSTTEISKNTFITILYNRTHFQAVP